MKPLMEAGMDSLGAVELRTALGAKFGIELPATITFDHPSVAALSGFLTGQAEVATESQVCYHLCADIRQQCQTLLAWHLALTAAGAPLLHACRFLAA